MTGTTQRSLDVPGAVLAYDVRGPLPTADGEPPLLLVGQPMDATGFATLAGLLPERTVVTYDPRGLGRSTRTDGSSTHDPVQQAEDLHALVGALGGGPVDVFGSSGGAVTSLALVAAHPQDVRTLVAHEPPALPVLPDAAQAEVVWQRVQAAYQARGWGAGMAAFVAMTSVPGPFTADSLAELPDPAAFGMPAEDDGSRDDPLLSGASAPVTGYAPDVAALQAAPTRVVVAAGIESKDLMTWRTSAALAEALGVGLTVFPSHHGGFMGPELGMPGQPEAFATRLREVLDAG
ncbi:alpha/beta fold hydrolase [Cellulomonas oligotrophica]|uniref:Hydrolase n=1 Tax=Cellulomonas oligotrophica TaxID=931536 RepID=A0A7Y9K110_9CELL|nr:alpha/beta hydrolase [Cellulomonas oligotrophica]NYD87860.1 pimeloyl-ACP methyl ester carboxylesterase [Cellulomonas oligotrophica]GIG32933.1 hydrolase [Cellulomonas oligotrophica]